MGEEVYYLDASKTRNAFGAFKVSETFKIVRFTLCLNDLDNYDTLLEHNRLNDFLCVFLKKTFSGVRLM